MPEIGAEEARGPLDGDWVRLGRYEILPGDVPEEGDGLRADAPALVVTGGFVLNKNPFLRQEADRPTSLDRALGRSKGGGISGLGEHPPLPTQQGVFGAIGEGIKHAHQAGEQPGVGVGISHRVVDEVHQIGPDIKRPERSAGAGIGVGEVPGGDGGEFAVGSDDGDDFALGEKLDPAGKWGFFAF